MTVVEIEIVTGTEPGAVTDRVFLDGPDAASLVFAVRETVRTRTGVDPATVSSFEVRIVFSSENHAPIQDAERPVTLQVPNSNPAVANAARVREFRQSLVDRGGFTVDDIAQGLGLDRITAQAWLEQHVEANRLFTVDVQERALVPASLLDSAFEPIQAWVPVIERLRQGEVPAWGMWAWIDGPQALLSGEVPSNVIRSDPARVVLATQRRFAQARH